MVRERSHEESIIELIRENHEFATEYIKVASEEIDLEGGEEALITASRHIVAAQQT